MQLCSAPICCSPQRQATGNVSFHSANAVYLLSVSFFSSVAVSLLLVENNDDRSSPLCLPEAAAVMKPLRLTPCSPFLVLRNAVDGAAGYKLPLFH